MSFGDVGPYFIATEESLAAVNKELQSPVAMKRFRPNVVVTGGLKAFEEVSCSLIIGSKFSMSSIL